MFVLRYLDIKIFDDYQNPAETISAGGTPVHHASEADCFLMSCALGMTSGQASEIVLHNIRDIEGFCRFLCC